MNDFLFARAAIQRPARVLGLDLFSYSIGHELWLQREQHPFVTGARLTSLTMGKLAEAVWCCSQNWLGVMGMNRRWMTDVLKLRLWRWRARKASLAKEVIAFVNYRNEGTLFPRLGRAGEPGGRVMGSPTLVKFVRFLVRERLASNVESAMDCPLGLAAFYYYSSLEEADRVRVLNPDESELEEYFNQEEILIRVNQ